MPKNVDLQTIFNFIQNLILSTNNYKKKFQWYSQISSVGSNNFNFSSKNCPKNIRF